MMMHSFMDMAVPSHPSQIYTTASTLEELSRQQLVAESAKRISQGSFNGYRPANSMRVVKPNSASNSPQAMQQRRRTLMDGNATRRRQYALDQAILNHQIQGQQNYDAYAEPVKRSSRPMSWHPSSQAQLPQMHIQNMPHFDVSQYLIPGATPYDMDMYTGYQPFPPTPAIYSGHASPVSTFSPLSLPFTNSEQLSHGMAVDSYLWTTPAYITPAPVSTNGSPGITEAFPDCASPSMEWETFAANGFNTCTAPPTPDTYQEVVLPEPTVPAEESIPYQALDDTEEDGEILVGMGLYDAPEKSETDPELDHYRTTTSNFLDSTYRKGAGLKLEEAWEPPKEDESSNEDDEDAEAENEE